MLSIGSYLNKEQAKKALEILSDVIGNKNVGFANADYMSNLLNFSEMRGYSKAKCLDIINKNW